MNACMGSDFAGEIAKSHARFVLSPSYDCFAACEDFDCVLDCMRALVRGSSLDDTSRWLRTDECSALKPGGGGRFFHLRYSA